MLTKAEREAAGVPNPMGDIWCKRCIEFNSNCRCCFPVPEEHGAPDPWALRSALVSIEVALTCANPATTPERRIERAVAQIHKALG